MNTTELTQERAKLIHEASELVATVDKEQRSLNSDEQKRFDELETNINKLADDIDASEKRAKAQWWREGLKATNAKTSIQPASSNKKDEKSQRNAFRAWLKLGYNKPLSAEERAACDAHDIHLGMQNYKVSSNRYLLSGFPEQRAMAEGSWTLSNSGASTGGALFTYMNIADLLDTALKAYGNLLNTSTIIETPNAFTLPLPTANDTSNSAAIVAENGTLSPVNIGSTATVSFGAYKLATAVVFSQELLADALFPLESWLAQQLGVRMARGMEGYLATGSGSSQPNGLCTAATNSGITVAGTTASPLLTFDNVIQLMNSIDPAYLQQEGCGFVGHQSVISLLQQIKTTTGEYIWREAGPAMSSQAARPLGQIYGYPVYMNNSFPAVNAGSGDVLLAFGQLKKYHVRKVNQVEFFSNPYLYSLNGQIVLQAWMRFDANLVDAGTHPIKVIVSP